MPTKATIKLIKQLQQKKYRKKQGLFVVEGRKSIIEFLKNGFIPVHFYITEAFQSEFPSADIITEKGMKQISGLTTPPNILAVFQQPQNTVPNSLDQICFALDGVQDPGNLGTIIRLADWFGLKDIFCSENTVDLYNPKVVQASMGSLSRVRAHYLNLGELINTIDVPVIGTFMEGENIYQTQFPSSGLLVMGNEANGISKEIAQLCTQKVSIPQNGNNTESLNVAIASSIIIGEVYSKKFKS
ncbi:RNA methyltransferase [Flavobacteriaceae bacterium Ap0902]|nr:RNA methyltransferase [Flavobacteriaceae bacterium Ap0902]